MTPTLSLELTGYLDATRWRWVLADAAHRIWAGERDPAALTEGLDEQDSALVRRVLELLAAPSP